MAYSQDDKARFVGILKAKNLHIGKACEAFGINRWTYYEWMKEETFSQAVKELEEKEIDDAEEMHSWLRRGILKVEDRNGQNVVTGWEKEPDRIALEKFLTTKGKHRGWQDSPQAVINGEFTIVTMPDNGRDKKEQPKE